jgi:hypothetical protein
MKCWRCRMWQLNHNKVQLVGYKLLHFLSFYAWERRHKCGKIHVHEHKFASEMWAKYVCTLPVNIMYWQRQYYFDTVTCTFYVHAKRTRVTISWRNDKMYQFCYLIFFILNLLNNPTWFLNCNSFLLIYIIKGWYFCIFTLVKICTFDTFALGACILCLYTCYTEKNIKRNKIIKLINKVVQN